MMETKEHGSIIEGVKSLIMFLFFLFFQNKSVRHFDKVSQKRRFERSQGGFFLAFCFSVISFFLYIRGCLREKTRTGASFTPG